MNDEKIKIKEVEIRPQYIAQICPRCNGYKTVSYGKYPCTLCNQLGFLKIPVEEVKKI